MSSLNYSFLLFARIPRLLQEVQLKRALGASTWKLTIELMTGPAAIVGIGFVLAAALFSLAMMVVASISPFYKQLVTGSWRTAALAIAVQFLISCALSLVVGLLPALPVLRQLSASGMGRSSTASRISGVLLQSVVTVQISFCIGALLIAGMVLSSLIGLMRVPLGYDPHQSAVIQLTPRSETISFISGNHHSFPDVEAIHAFERDFVGLPGVESISYGTYVPFGEIPGTVFIERIPGNQAGGHTVNTVTVSPGYFHTMRTSIVRGHGFPPHSHGSLEVIVNMALSKELWPDKDPINGSIHVVVPAFSGMPSSSFMATVIGVCEDIRISGAAETPTPTIILSTDGASFFNIDPSFIIRTVLPLHTIESAAQANASRLLPDFHVSAVESIEEKAHASLSPERTRTICAVAGALLMTLVCLLGLYASLSYYVTSRRRELAVRICLGASKASLRKIIMTRAALCAGFSALITVPFWPFLAALSLNEYLGRLTWSLPHAVCISLTCICLSVGLSIIPAAKAIRISPSQALKEE